MCQMSALLFHVAQHIRLVVHFIHIIIIIHNKFDN